MKKTRILLILIALLIVSVNALAATVSIPDTNANAGATVQIPIYANWDFQLTAFQFTIAYNPSVLNCTGAVPGDTLSGINGWSVGVNALSGQIVVVGNDASGNGIAPGSGNLVKLQCTAVGSSGDSTAISFTGTNELVDTDINGYTPATTPGTFTTGACTPSAEICDGLDNNCDGQIDNGIAPVPSTCGIGACAASGETTCQSGQLVDNCTPGTPQGEGPFENPNCSDELDNDCDGLTDAADPSCVNCTPSQEICDGLDNDCDGQVDNNITPVPSTCGIGACAASGETTCQSGQLVDNCTPGTPQGEGPFSNPTCSDALDNDCDGLTDAADQGCVRQQTGMDHWLGQWFTVKRTMKGNSFRATDSKYLIDKNAGNGYMHIWGWDPESEDLHFDYYEFREDDDLWHTYTDVLHFFAGTDNKFLFWYTSGDATFLVSFNGLIDGRVKNGILQNASLKALGGLYCDISDDNTRYSAGEQTVTGKMIDASKVPVPDNLILPH